MVVRVVFTILELLSWVVIADALLSWVVRDPSRFPRNLTTRITEPMYRPIRRVIDPSKTGGLDLSPLIVILLIQGVRALLLRA